MRIGIALSALLFANLASAQEYRATVLGTVSDPHGAKVPQAAIIITNVESGVVSKTAANESGSYQISFLIPGNYVLEVTHPGFKSYKRGPIELRINDRTKLDVAMEVGRMNEQVTVTAEAALLEETTGGGSQVVGADQIVALPLDGHNPFSLMNLGAGVTYTGSMLYSRPFDNGAIADFSINGGQSGTNEYQIDGVSNNANTGRSNLAYVPPAESTQEFRVQSNIYDAQYGRTGGGVINLSIKPGTNRYHGAGYEYMRRTSFDANQFASNAAGQPRARRIVDQYGGEIDGPVNIPGLYQGKDRTFFMFSMEQYREANPQPLLGSIPTADQRAGDYSKTFTAANKLYTIYDPLLQYNNPDFVSTKAITLTNLRYLRTPFPGNLVPKSRMEPIALRVLQDIPLPNQTGDPVTHLNNWFGADVGEKNAFRNLIARVDHVISPRWRIYGRGDHNNRDGGVIDYNGWATAATRQIHAGRMNDGGVFDVTGTLTPTTIFTGRVGFNRFLQLSTYKPIDISSLGLPSSFVKQLQMPDSYPQFTFENYLQTGISQWDITPSETYSAQAGMTHIMGSHTLKYGVEYRLMHYAGLLRGNASGTFGFTRAFTSISPDTTDPNSGNGIASFLLGYMNNASATLNAAPYSSWKYPVVYVQEDWRATRKLTINIGLRWDYESPVTERYDRQTRGFDYNAPWPIKANGVDVRGGLLFSGLNSVPRGAFKRDLDNIQPRFGFAYRPFSKPLVIRGGFGRSYLPTIDLGGTTGYSQTTNAEVSSVDGKSIRVLNNPFPSGLVQPPGKSNGIMTQAGDNISFNDPGRSIPFVWQFSFGFQYEFVPGNLIEINYSGSQTHALPVSRSLNVLTSDQLALGTLYLNTGFTNPYYGVLPPASPRGSVTAVQRRVLLLPYPQFNSITETNVSIGRNWYNSMQVKFERRFKKGFSLLSTYAWSKNMAATTYLNPQDTQMSRELVSYDIPHRFVISGIYELPLGPKKQFFNHGVAGAIVGGWQLSWTGTSQSGTPIPLPDYYINGDPRLPSDQQTLSHWFNTSPSLWSVRPPDTLRTAKLYSPNIRRNTAPQFNTTVIRNFRITDRQRFQFKVTAFNLANTPVFGNPNTSPASPLFGVVPITQINLPRALELGFRYSF